MTESTGLGRDLGREGRPTWLGGQRPLRGSVGSRLRLPPLWPRVDQSANSPLRLASVASGNGLAGGGSVRNAAGRSRAATSGPGSRVTCHRSRGADVGREHTKSRPRSYRYRAPGQWRSAGPYVRGSRTGGKLLARGNTLAFNDVTSVGRQTMVERRQSSFELIERMVCDPARPTTHWAVCSLNRQFLQGASDEPASMRPGEVCDRFCRSDLRGIGSRKGEGSHGQDCPTSGRRPHPALKYQLLPPLIDRRPGNAVTQYMKAPHERNVLFSDRKFWETVMAWMEMPLSELRKARDKSPQYSSLLTRQIGTMPNDLLEQLDMARGANRAIGPCRFANTITIRSSCLRFKPADRSHGFSRHVRSSNSPTGSTTKRFETCRPVTPWADTSPTVLFSFNAWWVMRSSTLCRTHWSRSFSSRGPRISIGLWPRCHGRWSTIVWHSKGN